MSLSLHEIVVPTLVGGLRGIASFLDKAVAYADAKKIEPRALLDARLYPDMFAFTRQIQIATDSARRGIDRLVGVEPSSVEDNEATFAELKARIEATIEHLERADRTAIDESENREFSVQLDRKIDFTGRTFAMNFLVPNFLFHITTAYNILRHNGVELGKRDYIMPHMMKS